MTATGGPIMGMPLAVPQSPSQPGSSPGVSPDGKWYWDGQQWRNVSTDGRFRWDGTQWVEMGTTYAARGAPPPPAATPTGWYPNVGPRGRARQANCPVPPESLGPGL